MPYFEERVTNGDWDEVENYLSGFTRPDENTNSKKIFNAIQEHKCLEVLDREDKEVSKYGDLINARSEMLAHVKKLIEENPVFCDKLIFPTFDPSALGTLSLNLQHHLASVSPSQSVPKPVESPPPFQDPSSLPQPSASNPHPSASAGFNTQNNSDNLKHPTTPTNKPAVENQNDLPELDLYETRSSEMSNEYPPLSISGDDNASTGSSIEDRVSPVNEDRQNMVDGKPRIADGSSGKSRLQKLIEVNKPSECHFLRLPDSLVAVKVPRLMYTNSGSAILALYVNAVHKLWKSPENDSNLLGKFPANCIQCCTARLMTGMNPEDAVPCFALSNNDSYVVSASGQEISYFNTLTFQTKKSFKSPSSAVTFLAFHPQNNNIIAIGLDDSSIQIYDVEANEVKTELKAHQKRITGLAFSNILNVLVSSGADSQLCVWSTDTWEKQTNEYLRSPAGASLAATLVQFHQDQTHLLAVQETQLVIYEAEVANLDWRVKWPLKASVSITYATYSCDSKSIYVSFKCGSISVLTAASLRLRCRINPSLYLPANPSLQAYPLVIAAHPSKPNQFAVGLSDGGVYVLEPLESEGKWYL
ncbi:topless-related 4-like isoform X1 [Olea europaea subsp. europaea]|uniref:Topless-related 4-like isoform X1 n=1 Tax=Olea europaea subsp. europaea TaxID=158383 RepID=A0A8S0R561_OLEEU|nr:topless-related 4-like isoform X1 [Olea europaea subsp. europaea]